ncbi:hypothetical protein [Lacticaseibacillus thailandensis]|uniref:hypothetical protein n=1 Tax=Lacticaseibacillus thailandensis TaxID=381741 RepID=UPI0006CF3206|nr:hypothetical protein [Lacticaseibacillus thailandensis]
MEINVQKYLDAVTNTDYVISEHTVQPVAVEQEGVAAALAPLLADAQTNLGAGRIMRSVVTIASAEPTTVALEAGVVNLPMADAKKITNFLGNDEIVPVRLYLVVANKFLNASGLRIDEVATADEFLAHPDQYGQAIVDSVTEKLAHIATEAAKPQEEVKPKTAAQATTRRTTRTAKKSHHKEGVNQARHREEDHEEGDNQNHDPQA